MSLLKKSQDKDYLNHLKDVFRGYYYLKDTYNLLFDENCELNDKIDEETLPKGIDYSKEPSGTSTVKPTPYINELILKQASLEQELYELERKIKHYEQDYRIPQMLKTLSEEDREYFRMQYEMKLSTGAIAKLKGCSQQNVHKHCDYILKKMVDKTNL